MADTKLTGLSQNTAPIGSDIQYMVADPGGSPAQYYATFADQARKFGGKVLLESHTAATSASLAFTSRNAPGQSGDTFQSDFDLYEAEMIGIVPSTNAVEFGMQFTSDGGSTWVTTSYVWALRYWGTAGDSGVATQAGGIGTTGIEFGGTLSNSGSAGGSGDVKIYAPLSTAKIAAVVARLWFLHSNGNWYEMMTSGTHTTAATAFNGLRFVMGASGAGGNIASGTINLYGIVQ